MWRIDLLRLKLWVLLGLSGLLGGCSVNFNFTGTGSVDTSLETLSVANFSNEAQIVVSYLAQEVTDQLQQRFLNQSRLTLTSGAADVELSGSVTRYTIQPVAIQGGDQAAQSRLTIDVRVVYENNVDPNDSWENTFSSFVDFDSEINFSSEEARLIDEVLEQITQDVFTKSIGKW